MSAPSWRFTDRAKRIAWALLTIAIISFGAAADLGSWFVR